MTTFSFWLFIDNDFEVSKMWQGMFIKNQLNTFLKIIVYVLYSFEKQRQKQTETASSHPLDHSSYAPKQLVQVQAKAESLELSPGLPSVVEAPYLIHSLLHIAVCIGNWVSNWGILMWDVSMPNICPEYFFFGYRMPYSLSLEVCQ